MTVRFLVLARLTEGGLPSFHDYEAAVLPLLADHGGRVERRLRTLDDRLEVHLVSFPSKEAFAAYRADPRRTAAAPMLASSGAVIELLEVRDLEPSA